MPATVTLATAILTGAVGPSDGRISVSSTAGMTPGVRLYVDGEVMAFLRLDVDPWVFVSRGVDGTYASPHASNLTIYIGRADQFYQGPPTGTPLSVIPVSPYIDTLNSKVYFAQGDATGTANRWWQVATTTYAEGALGARTATTDPSAST